jgi:hypothetical protein
MDYDTVWENVKTKISSGGLNYAKQRKNIAIRRHRGYNHPSVMFCLSEEAGMPLIQIGADIGGGKGERS